MNKKIVPAIIPASLESLRKQVGLLSGVTNDFQIDIVDGVFVPFMSWPIFNGDEPQSINGSISDFEIEFDLMIKNPENTIDDWLLTTASRFVIHIESTDDVALCIERIKNAGRKVGLSLNNDTNISEIESYMKSIDFIQCMGIAEIGRQGNGFDERVLDRVVMIKEKYPDLEVSVDGSVNFDTIKRLKNVGVDRFISGSAILYASNPVEAFSKLTSIIS